MCSVYIYYVYINTHTYSIYLENIYTYLHVYMYIHIVYIIYLIYKRNIFFWNIYMHVCVFIHNKYTYKI